MIPGLFLRRRALPNGSSGTLVQILGHLKCRCARYMTSPRHMCRLDDPVWLCEIVSRFGKGYSPTIPCNFSFSFRLYPTSSSILFDISE